MPSSTTSWPSRALDRDLDRKAADDIIGLYQRRAAHWVADRGRTLTEDDRRGLEALTADLRPGDRVLDVGCGSGRPIAAALLDQGLAVTGVDASAALIAHAAADLPTGRFRVADMRALDLGETFRAVIAWHSLFHLTPDDQRVALPGILAHAAPRASVLFTSGPAEGSTVGVWRGEPLYHGSLDPDEYRAVLTAHGFEVDREVRPGAASFWLARRDG